MEHPEIVKRQGLEETDQVLFSHGAWHRPTRAVGLGVNCHAFHAPRGVDVVIVAGDILTCQTGTTPGVHTENVGAVQIPKGVQQHGQRSIPNEGTGSNRREQPSHWPHQEAASNGNNKPEQKPGQSKQTFPIPRKEILALRAKHKGPTPEQTSQAPHDRLRRRHQRNRGEHTGQHGQHQDQRNVPQVPRPAKQDHRGGRHDHQKDVARSIQGQGVENFRVCRSLSRGFRGPCFFEFAKKKACTRLWRPRFFGSGVQFK
ncbi:hypothetical protein BCR42DRAFT_398192 [Absidia repens]|uniref:Uncharacterized protein n=1 Tax=Absidia repens TaxID=90262 RepID=A0A1X2HYZ7_9FUNG|nr:hypothetical protein BCR42DRAFT_398192 [Absidia repens]